MMTIAERHHGIAVQTAAAPNCLVDRAATIEPVCVMPPATDQRLHEERTERLRLLAHEAEVNGLTAEQEAPGRYVVRDPRVVGVCQLVTPFSCTCPGYGIFRRCEHLALVRKLEGLI